MRISYWPSWNEVEKRTYKREEKRIDNWVMYKHLKTQCIRQNKKKLKKNDTSKIIWRNVNFRENRSKEWRWSPKRLVKMVGTVSACASLSAVTDPVLVDLHTPHRTAPPDWYHDTILVCLSVRCPADHCKRLSAETIRFSTRMLSPEWRRERNEISEWITTEDLRR